MNHVVYWLNNKDKNLRNNYRIINKLLNLKYKPSLLLMYVFIIKIFKI